MRKNQAKKSQVMPVPAVVGAKGTDTSGAPSGRRRRVVKVLKKTASGTLVLQPARPKAAQSAGEAADGKGAVGNVVRRKVVRRKVVRRKKAKQTEAKGTNREKSGGKSSAAIKARAMALAKSALGKKKKDIDQSRVKIYKEWLSKKDKERRLATASGWVPESEKDHFPNDAEKSGFPNYTNEERQAIQSLGEGSFYRHRGIKVRRLLQLLSFRRDPLHLKTLQYLHHVLSDGIKLKRDVVISCEGHRLLLNLLWQQLDDTPYPEYVKGPECVRYIIMNLKLLWASIEWREVKESAANFDRSNKVNIRRDSVAALMAYFASLPDGELKKSVAKILLVFHYTEEERQAIESLGSDSLHKHRVIGVKRLFQLLTYEDRLGLQTLRYLHGELMGSRKSKREVAISCEGNRLLLDLLWVQLDGEPNLACVRYIVMNLQALLVSAKWWEVVEPVADFYHGNEGKIGRNGIAALMQVQSYFNADELGGEFQRSLVKLSAFLKRFRVQGIKRSSEQSVFCQRASRLDRWWDYWADELKPFKSTLEQELERAQPLVIRHRRKAFGLLSSGLLVLLLGITFIALAATVLAVQEDDHGPYRASAGGTLVSTIAMLFGLVFTFTGVIFARCMCAEEAKVSECQAALKILSDQMPKPGYYSLFRQDEVRPALMNEQERAGPEIVVLP